ncbi:MAG: 50S ribosomal protein L10 [Bacteroidota bacterium]
MKKEEKNKIIDGLVEQFKVTNHFYVTDISDLDVETTNNLRRLCYNKNVKLQVAKNTFIQKALERTEGDFAQIFDVLKGSSAIMFCETANVPAKLIKEFRKKNPKPILKGAFVESSIFIGDSQVDSLSKLKSKNELIGDIIMILQSPAKNVLGALQSGGNTIAGVVKTLSERA